MLPSFTYPELLKRFCEGFAFYPFKALEQYGGFIYKCYTRENNTPKVLEQYCKECDFSSLHAQVLLLKLQQKDIPIAGELLSKLQSAGQRLEKRFYALRKPPAIYKQLLETMETYHRILAVYQSDVQQHIATQLTTIADSPDDDQYKEVSADNIRQIQLVVRDFLHSTDIICSFLKGCVEKMPGFVTLILMPEEQESLIDLIKTMGQLRDLQRKSIYVLEQWKQQMIHFEEQQTMN